MRFTIISISLLCFCSNLFAISISKKSIRSAFIRMESTANIEFEITNDTDISLSNLTVSSKIENIVTKLDFIKELSGLSNYSFIFTFDTKLKPGDYPMLLTVSDVNDNPIAQLTTTVYLRERSLPSQMPVILHGWYGDISILKEIGFTHRFLFRPVDHKKVWDANSIIVEDSARVDGYKRELDEACKDQFGFIATLDPGRSMSEEWGGEVLKQYFRIDGDGNPYTGHTGVCAALKVVNDFAYKVGASTSLTYKDFPSLEAAMIESEVRDSTEICFHNHGKKIPTEVISKDGLSYTKQKNFPATRVIEDNDNILNYMKWFWQRGDGWNEVFSSSVNGVKAYRNDIWTFYDPAVRVPSVSGSGGDVDFISQWTYTYPDPIKIGRATDELFAMAKLSNKSQDVMKMTQAIWYRSAVVTPNIDESVQLADWEKEQPEGPYITVAPDHLREAFWSKISRPVKGIMYHGWESLVASSVKKSYICTNEKTKDVLQELIAAVVKPLGPTLMQVPDRKSDIAFLESFTSQMYASVGDRGWTEGWGNDAYLILGYAQLQPEVIYEETLLRYGLNSYKVLVLVECPVLTMSVVNAIKDFQSTGGIVIADEMLVPEIYPDIVVESYERKRQSVPDKDKQVLLDKANDLRKELDAFYSRFVDSSNSQVLVRARKYGSTDYIFVVNDNRTFGDYVGQHRLVMEKGVPASSRISVARQSGYVYDLVESGKIAVSSGGASLDMNVNLDGGGGKLYMITDEQISGISIACPEVAKLGRSIQIKVDVKGDSGRNIDAVIPLDIKILDADNKLAEFSGFYGAKDGHLELSLDIASNEKSGKWQILVKDLASGLIANRNFMVD